MKKAILGVFLLTVMTAVLSINFASALGMTGRLEYKMDPGQTVCQNVFMMADGVLRDFTTRDKWSNITTDYNINHYIFKATDVGLNISYQPSVTLTANQSINVQVCIGATEPGVYRRGVIIFTPKTVDSIGNCIGACVNQVVEYGVWLLVNTTGTPKIEVQPTATTQPTVTSPTQQTPPTVAKVTPKVSATPTYYNFGKYYRKKIVKFL